MAPPTDTGTNVHNGRRAILRIQELASDQGLQIAPLSDGNTEGDAIVIIPGSTPRYIEVKYLGCDKSGQINQIRGLSYMPVVIWREPVNKFYVLSASDVLAILVRKGRGQHGELALENGVIHVTNAIENHFVVEPRELAEKIRAAITRSDEAYLAIKEDLESIKNSLATIRTKVKCMRPKTILPELVLVAIEKKSQAHARKTSED